MRALPKPQLSKVLAVAYLISTAAITVATSKHDSGGPPLLVDPAISYEVNSTCTTTNPRAFILVQNGKILNSIDANGVHQVPSRLDFISFGFPYASMIIGTDQVKVAGSLNLTCLVRTSDSRPNPDYNPNPPAPAPYQPEFLDRYAYDCFEFDAHRCTINLDESPTGSVSY